MKEEKNNRLIINYDLLDEFCKINNFIIITDELLTENNMYKELIYATNDNFVGRNLYPKDMPLLISKIVWEKLININKKLNKNSLFLKIYDAYRPIEIQKILWEYFFNTYGYYDENLVSNPDKYGEHNIIINAVDLMLVNSEGKDIEMPCKFDDFTGKANIYFDDCSENAKKNRDLLINIAKQNGLIVNTDEWWHFFDDSLAKYGKNYDFSQSKYVPKEEHKVFILE